MQMASLLVSSAHGSVEGATLAARWCNRGDYRGARLQGACVPHPGNQQRGRAVAVGVRSRGSMLVHAAAAPAFSSFAEAAEDRGGWSGRVVRAGSGVPAERLRTSMEMVMRVCGGAVSGMLEHDAVDKSDGGGVAEECLELRRDVAGSLFWGDGCYTAGLATLDPDTSNVFTFCLTDGNERVRATVTVRGGAMDVCAAATAPSIVRQRAGGDADDNVPLPPFVVCTAADAEVGQEGAFEGYVTDGEAVPGGPGGAKWDECFVQWRFATVAGRPALPPTSTGTVLVAAADDSADGGGAILYRVTHADDTRELGLLWREGGLGIARIYSPTGALLRIARYTAAS